MIGVEAFEKERRKLWKGLLLSDEFCRVPMSSQPGWVSCQQRSRENIEQGNISREKIEHLKLALLLGFNSYLPCGLTGNAQKAPGSDGENVNYD